MFFRVKKGMRKSPNSKENAWNLSEKSCTNPVKNNKTRS